MKTLKLIFTFLLILVISGCANKQDTNTLTIAASLEPHATILEEAKTILKEDYGIHLKIKILDDYFLFNKALSNGEIDANFFQHIPFFEEELQNNHYDLVNVGKIHIEPFGIYSSTHTKDETIRNGAKIIISNSVADNGRIFAILAKAGWIDLPEDHSIFETTIAQIQNNPQYNPKNLQFEEIKPELLTLAYNNHEGDYIAINGNYALQNGLSPATDSVLLETANEDNPYVNIIATTRSLEKDERIQALIEVLQSNRIQSFIHSTYSNGSVIPVTN